MITIAQPKVLAGRAELVSQMPAGVFPKVRETGEVAGGRLGFAVTEYVPGYSLYDLQAEGRALSATELRGLGLDIGHALQAVETRGFGLVQLGASDLLYDTTARHWRLVALPELSPTRLRSQLPRLADLMWEASGVGLKQNPPWQMSDPCLYRLLLRARSGRMSLRGWCSALGGRRTGQVCVAFGTAILLFGVLVHFL